MTTAIFTQHSKEHSISITGHAGYSNLDPDIVCSACSVLACTLMQCVLCEEAVGNLKTLNTLEDNGNVNIRFVACDHAAVRMQSIVETIATGFAMLSHEYPDNVKLSVKTGER
ncbi:MAG: ribosomal-processing cysteine protease Prp [Bacteroides sp.]